MVKKIKPDSFGMYPHNDEILGVDWIMDFNDYEDQGDSRGTLIFYLSNQIERGKLKVPRDKDSTK